MRFEPKVTLDATITMELPLPYALSLRKLLGSMSVNDAVNNIERIYPRDNIPAIDHANRALKLFEYLDQSLPK